jgi:hypothetical protein
LSIIARIENSGVKQLFHIKASGSEETAQQVLSLSIGEKHCGFAITDKTGDQLYELAYYCMDTPAANPLPGMIEKYPELDRSFYKVVISYDYPQSTLVPLQHYKQEDTGSLLKSLYGINSGSSVISESIAEWQVYNVYAVPQQLHDWVSRKFAAGSYWHQYTLLVKNMDTAQGGNQLLIDFRRDDFTLVAVSGNKLLLTQSFYYSTPEDVLYYLLKVCQEFGFSQQEVQVSVSGLIDKQSALYKELYQYFIHITFREAGWNITGSEYPAHFFTSLNDLARCAS